MLTRQPKDSSRKCQLLVNILKNSSSTRSSKIFVRCHSGFAAFNVDGRALCTVNFPCSMGAKQHRCCCVWSSRSVPDVRRCREETLGLRRVMRMSRVWAAGRQQWYAYRREDPNHSLASGCVRSAARRAPSAAATARRSRARDSTARDRDSARRGGTA